MSAQEFTLYDMFQRNACNYADRPAVIHDQGQLTFRDFLARVDSLATGLAGLGLTQGERICVLAQNHLSYLDLYGASAKLGCIVYPINWRLTGEEAARIIDRAEPGMLVIDETTEALVADLRNGNTSIAHWYRFGAEPAAGFTAFDSLYDLTHPTPPPVAAADDPFAVVSTAAVEIVPRGAVLTQGNMLAANLQNIAVMGLNETDCVLMALPLFHIAALGSSLATMHAGGANVLMTRFDAEAAARGIEAHHVTYLMSFPPVLSTIMDAAAALGTSLASVRHVSGLEAPDTIERLHQDTSAQFWSGFGQTETSGFVTLQRYSDHPGSAGKSGPLCRVKLVDDYDREVPLGTPGEIIVRGPLVFQGYFREPEVTEHTFRHGWHHTGDVGRFDDKGYLYYVKRKAEKELIKPGGENVYPAEVESIIMELDGVQEVCVFGVPDSQWGEAIKAAVELETGTDLNAEQVIDYVGRRIARFKRPKWVDFTPALPKTEDGLIDRDAVKSTWGDAS